MRRRCLGDRDLDRFQGDLDLCLERDLDLLSLERLSGDLTSNRRAWMGMRLEGKVLGEVATVATGEDISLA